MHIRLHCNLHKNTSALRARQSDLLLWALLSASAVSIVTVFDVIWLTIFVLIRLNCGFNLIRLNFLIQFNSRLMYLFLTRFTQFESHFSQASGSPTLARMSLKYSNTKIVEYSTILIIEIGFSENTKNKIKTREAKIYPQPRLSSGNLNTLNKKTKKKIAQWRNHLQNYVSSLQLLELIPIWPKKPKKKISQWGNPLQFLVS